MLFCTNRHSYSSTTYKLMESKSCKEQPGWDQKFCLKLIHTNQHLTNQCLQCKHTLTYHNPHMLEKLPAKSRRSHQVGTAHTTLSRYLVTLLHLETQLLSECMLYPDDETSADVSAHVEQEKLKQSSFCQDQELNLGH